MTGPGDEMAAGTAGRGRLRASRADREQVIDTLKAAFVQDRLAKNEFDLRVGQALASRTYADLAALTADIPAGLTGAQLPGKAARARARPPANTDVKTGRVITATTMLTAGLWAAVFSAHAETGKAALLLITFTFAWLVILILAGVVMLESRHQKRSGGQLPPWPASSAGGQHPGARHPAAGRTAPADRSRSAHRRSGPKPSSSPAIAQLAVTVASSRAPLRDRLCRPLTWRPPRQPRA